MKKSLPNDVYDKIAESYSRKVETKPYNAYYDRPAVLSLIPEVNNKHILDAGCGPGVYMSILSERGAIVTGIDANEKMIDLARKRLGEKGTLHLANLEEPLHFLKKESYDGIISALAISYVKDYKRLFAQFNRLLKPEGWFVFSTEHPFNAYQYFNIENYFETQKVEAEWKGFDPIVTMPTYYHSLSCITEALFHNGFMIERIIEPKPTSDFEKVRKISYDKLMKFPAFICFRAVKIKPRL